MEIHISLLHSGQPPSVQPFPPLSPPSPSLSPLSPPLSFPSFPFFLPSEAFRSSFRTKKRSLGQRQPLLQQALTLAPLDTLARPPMTLVPPETVADVAVPRPLSVEQIAAPSPTELLPSRFQIATAERSRRERANFAHLILRRIPEFLGVSGCGAVADSAERLRALFRTRFTIETSRASLAGCRPSRL